MRDLVTVREQVFHALITPNLFKELPVSKCLALAQTNVSRMLTSPHAQEIRQTFVNCGLDAQVGYNQGSDLLSVTFPLPTLKQQRAPLQSPAQALMWAMLGLLHEQPELEASYSHYATTCADEAEFREAIARDDQNKERASSTGATEEKKDADVTTIATNTLSTSSLSFTEAAQRTVTRLLANPLLVQTPPLLANKALHVFASQALVLVTQRRVDLVLQRMTLVLQVAKRGYMSVDQIRSGVAPRLSFLLSSDERTDVLPTTSPIFKTPMLLSDDSTAGYRFHPAYIIVSAANPALLSSSNTSTTETATSSGDPPYWSQETLEAQRDALIHAFLEAFWRHVTEVMRYFPGSDLMQQVSRVLMSYVDTAARSQAATFTPERTLNIFLNGTPGTGKSTFVRVFTEALRFVVSRVFEPAKRMEIVRVPFNQTSPAALATMLMVRGISDWSLERIVEQTVCRGGISVLHLEEQPADQNLQNELFALTCAMTKTLTTRYPEYRNNVLNILTSNYEPSKEIASKAQYVLISPPDADTQREWCARTLEDTIASNVLLLTSAQQQHLLTHFQSTTTMTPFSSSESGSNSGSGSASGLGSLPIYLPHPSPPPYFHAPTSSSFSSTPSSSLVGTPHASTVRHAVLTATEMESVSALVQAKVATVATPSSSAVADGEAKASDDTSLVHPVLVQFLTAITLEAPPPFTPDMRKLETWKRCLGFAILSQLHSHLHLVYPSILPRLQSLTKEESSSSKALFVTLAACARIFIDANSASPASSSESPRSLQISISINPVPDSASASLSSPIVLPELQVSSPDSFFFFRTGDIAFPTSQSTSSSTSVNASVDASALCPSIPQPLSVLPFSSMARISAVIEMWLANFLKPAVIVLHGPRKDVETAALCIRHIIHNQCIPAPIPTTATTTSSASASSSLSTTTSATSVFPSTSTSADRSVVPASVYGDVPFVNNNIFRHEVDPTIAPSDPSVLAPEDAAKTLFKTVDPETLVMSTSLSSSPSPSQERRNDVEVWEYFARALSERDKRLMLGDPDPSSGTLLRFIHNVNNQTKHPDAKPAVGVVYCLANGPGQFMLRDLMDSGESSTHVTNVRKDGLLFIVCVPSETTSVQPQLVSRAHHVEILQ